MISESMSFHYVLCPQFILYILCSLDVYVTVFSVSSSSWAFLVSSILTSQLLRIHCLFCYIALSCGHVSCFLLWQPSTLSRILGSASFAAFERSWFITCCLDNYLKIGCQLRSHQLELETSLSLLQQLSTFCSLVFQHDTEHVQTKRSDQGVLLFSPKSLMKKFELVYLIYKNIRNRCFRVKARAYIIIKFSHHTDLYRKLYSKQCTIFNRF